MVATARRSRLPVHASPPFGLGAFVGAVGGLVAGLVKLGCESVVPPRPPGRVPEPAILIAHLTGHAASSGAVTAVHFAFSVATGALYGALVEALPIVGAGIGVGFCLAVWAVAYELAVRLLGLTTPLARLPASERINETITHGLWGWTVELKRHDLRHRDADI